MRYHAAKLDHVRWRSEVLADDFSAAPSIGEFVEFMGRETALLGWYFTDTKAGKGLSLELSRDEAMALHQLLGERLSIS